MTYTFEVEKEKYNVDPKDVNQVEVAASILISAINDEQNKIYDLQKRHEPTKSTGDKISEAEEKIKAYKSYMSDIIELSGAQMGEE